MKGKFDAYVLWPLDKMVQNWIVVRSTARNFTVDYCVKVREKDENLIRDERIWTSVYKVGL